MALHDAEASTREATLTLLLRSGEATAASLAAELEVSVQAMRRHLRSLEQDGLIESSHVANGPGRPSNHWRLTAAGRGRFPDGSEHFALGLLQSMAQILSPEQLRALMGVQARAQAAHYRQQLGNGPLPQRLERLVELRRREGYVADFRRGDQPGDWLVREFHCSVARIAERYPFVCDQELQLFRMIFPDCRVERVHWTQDGDHFCGFTLRRRPAAVAAPTR